jgi:collagen type VII alpha
MAAATRKELIMVDSAIVAIGPHRRSASQGRAVRSAAQEIAFIDPAVFDPHVLLAGLRPGVEPILLNAAEPAPKQMVRTLAGYRNLAAIHVIAHGAPGRVSFAAGGWSAETLADQAEDFAAIGQALDEGGELQLWSCAAGSGAEGEALVARLTEVTGAMVVAAAG